MTDRAGQQLGNYRLVHLLGRGGFADVYLGEHVRLHTQAAIKVLHAQLAEQDVDSFLTEAQTIAHLVHPHIVRVFDFDLEGDVPFLVVDYAPNGSLRQRCPRGVPLRLPTIISYVKQVADALQYAHDAKLIHRDVKPENMLLGRRKEILLSDFGTATIAQSSRYQSAQDIAGTMAYMAPEQIQAHPRPASDQYALGVVVYEWLSGNRPFYGTFNELATKHISTPAPSLREQLPTLSPDVEEVVLTALAKDPHQRFKSIGAFATALEQASQSGQFSLVRSHFLFVPTLPLPPKPPLNATPLLDQASPPAQPPTIAPRTPTQPVTHRKGLSRRGAAVLIALALLIVGGTSLLYMAARTYNTHLQATATAEARITATSEALAAAFNAYNTAVASNGVMFGFDAQHMHFNPYEKVLNPTNVSGLVQDWTASIQSQIDSSPAVASGGVYVGSDDRSL